MRKAGLKNRGRSKGKNESHDGISDQGVDTMQLGGASNNVERRRQLNSNDEAALTNKNYRLAKELSELRIRLRDESKAVTRLTMENMNLATKCREAMSHAAVRERELLLAKKENAELRERINNGDAGSSSSARRSPDKDFDRTSPMPPPPPPPPPPHHSKYANPPQDHSLSPHFSKQEVFPVFGDNAAFAENTGQKIKRSSPNLSNAESSFSESTMSHLEGPVDELLFDKQIGSNPSSTSNVTNPSKQPVNNFLQSSRMPPSSSNNNEAKDEFDPNDFQPFSTPDKLKPNNNASSSLQHSSSLDAFEASWSSTFPTTFSNSEKEASASTSFDVPEFNDPFFFGSGNAFGELSSSSFEAPSSGKRGGSKLNDSPNKINEFDSTAQFDGRYDNEKKSNQNRNDASSDPTLSMKQPFSSDVKSGNKFDGFDSSPSNLFPTSAMDVFEFVDDKAPVQTRKMNGAKTPTSLFQTPTNGSPDDSSSNSYNPSPPPLNKKVTTSRIRNVAHSAAQSGFGHNNFSEKANVNFNNGHVQTQNNANMASRRSRSSAPQQTSTSGAAFFDNKHPTRMNQSVVDQRTDNLSRNSPTSGKISPKGIDTSKSTFKLPSSFNGPSSTSSSESVSSTRSKRNTRQVRHPVSYAEPNLNSKLRRGDVFFPKKDSTPGTEKTQNPSLPGKSSPSDFPDPALTLTDDILKDLASSSVIHT